MKRFSDKYAWKLIAAAVLLVFMAGQLHAVRSKIFSHSHQPLHQHQHEHSGHHEHPSGEPTQDNSLNSYSLLITAKTPNILGVAGSSLGVLEISPLRLRGETNLAPRFHSDRPPAGQPNNGAQWLISSLTVAPNSPPVLNL